MSSALFKPTDLRAPGAIDDLLAFHRARFGDLRMEDAGGDKGGGDDAADKAAADKAAADKAAADKAAADAKGSDKGFPDGVAVEQMTSAQREAYWKYQSRKHEDRVKALGNLTPEALKALQDKATKHDELERELMSDKDKAIAEAKDKANAAAIPRVVRAEFKAAAKGVLSADQLTALLEDRDLTKYVDANGDPDEDKIDKLIKAFAPSGTQGRGTGPGAGGLGRTGGTPTEPGAQGRAMAERRFGAKK